VQNSQDNHLRFAAKYDHVSVNAVEPKFRLTQISAAMPNLREPYQRLERFKDLALHPQSDALAFALFNVL